MGERAVLNSAILERLGISFMLSCCELTSLSAQAAPLKRQQLHMHDNASEQLAQHLPRALAFLDEAKASGGKCVVHCTAGMSRSPTVVLAYLIACDGRLLADAWSLVHACHQ